MKNKVPNALLALVGILSLIPGVIEVLLPLTGETYVWGQVAFQGDFMPWRGLILISSGCFYLLAINRTNRIQRRAQIILASLMIWIVVAMEILSRLLGSIPGGDGRWVKTPQGFLSSYTGPFIPSLFLLPISVALVLWVLYLEGKDERAK